MRTNVLNPTAILAIDLSCAKKFVFSRTEFDGIAFRVRNRKIVVKVGESLTGHQFEAVKTLSVDQL